MLHGRESLGYACGEAYQVKAAEVRLDEVCLGFCSLAERHDLDFAILRQGTNRNDTRFETSEQRNRRFSNRAHLE